MQLTEGGVLFFRESCFKPSGDKKRGNNPTHYRYSGSEDSLKLWVHSISILPRLHAIVAVAPAMTIDITDPAAVSVTAMLDWLQGDAVCLVSPLFTAMSPHTLFPSCIASLRSMFASHGQPPGQSSSSRPQQVIKKWHASMGCSCRSPKDYFAVVDALELKESDGRYSHFELISCKCVDTYVRVKKNQSQICWKWRKVSESTVLETTC